MLEEILISGMADLGLDCSPDAVQKLRRYADQLTETNRVMNLTAITEEDDIARLHFLDCAALLKMADFHGKRVIDVGTGAGFPGLVLKILCPDLELTLLDSLDKRIHFLQTVCDELSLTGVTCIHARAEEPSPELRGHFDIATARAVAGLNILSELCLPYVKRGGTFLAMKGPDCAEEVRAAKKAAALTGGQILEIRDYEIPGSGIHHAAVIVQKTGATPARYPRRWAQIKKAPL